MKLFENKKPVTKIRGVHLDLKGMPPTETQFLRLLDYFKELRLNCVLIEWEDMYPWKLHPEFRNSTAYTEKEVDTFLSRAEKNGIEVIPLVQSYGHLETVLSKPKFRHMREMPDIVSEICPCKKGAQEVVVDLVRDVLRTHEGRIKYFHIGGDEAWSLGTCPQCKAFVKKYGKGELYLKQLTPALDYAISKGVRPILWDDMMRHWTVADVKKIAKKADLMAWTYQGEVYSRIKPEMFELFKKGGVTLWGAGAYRGAIGPFADVTHEHVHAENMLSWTKLVKKHNFTGIVATGWARYSTFIVPCETNESCLASLALTSKIMWDGKYKKDDVEKVKGFVSKGFAGKNIASIYLRCRHASEEMAKWRSTMASCFFCLTYLAMLAGEPGRIDIHKHKERLLRLKNTLEKRKALAVLFTSAYIGLIPAIWIKNYLTSRFLPELHHAAMCFSKKKTVL
ncbi:MAG: family 20 glycosylhydrolase [Elusimicrobiota bacterium]